MTTVQARGRFAAFLARSCGDAKGTDAGYQRHRYYGTRPCLECCAAHNAYERARYERTVQPRELRPCGTASAYRRHLRHREIPCDACVVAHREEVRRYTRPHGERGRRVVRS